MITTDNSLENLRQYLKGADKMSADDVPVLVEKILAAARASGASDLHLEPKAERLILRLRLDGCLVDSGELYGALRQNVIQRVKVLAGLMTYRTDIPQEGRIQKGGAMPVLSLGEKASGSLEDLRVSVYPTLFGERAIIRLYAQGAAGENAAAVKTLDETGFAPADLSRFKQLLDYPQGLLLLTGPAGSGKTTTLYACLRHLVAKSQGRRHIVTIEDPVEQQLDGVTHTQINVPAELDFSAALRALLRQDPEVLMIGEIRDAETAEIAVQAALTGHLLLSTIHAASSPEVLVRLVQLGVEPFLVGSVVSGVLAQRLFRVLCLECRVTTRTKTEPFHPGAGCEKCRMTGYRGRALLAELLVMNEPLRAALKENAGSQKLAALAAESGCRGLWMRAQAEVAAGRTTLDEVRRILVPDFSGA